MKKTFLFFLTAVVAVCLLSCSDDKGGDKELPNAPIENLNVPPSSESNPVSTGSLVTISGTGFESGDQIWFRLSTRASGDVQAENVSVSSTGISFTAPEMNGQTLVILKRASTEYSLATMYFSTDTQSSAGSRLIGVLWGYDSKGEDVESISFIEINPQTGTHTAISKLSGNWWPEDNSAMVYAPANGLVYGLGWLEDGDEDEDYGGLCSFDYKTGKVNLIAEDWFSGTGDSSEEASNFGVRSSGNERRGLSIGVIDGKLHGVVIAGNNQIALVEISESGNETVKHSVSLDNADSYEFDGSVFYHNSEYDIIYFTIYQYGNGVDKVNFIAWDLTAGSIIAQKELKQGGVSQSVGGETEYEKEESCVLAGNELYMFAIDGWEYESTDVFILDPQTLETAETVTVLNDMFYYPVYMEESGLFFGNDYDFECIRSFSPSGNQTKNIMAYPRNAEITNLFIVKD